MYLSWAAWKQDISFIQNEEKSETSFVVLALSSVVLLFVVRASVLFCTRQSETVKQLVKELNKGKMQHIP